MAEEERDAFKKELAALELSLEISRQDLQGALYICIEFMCFLFLLARAFFAAKGCISHRARVCSLLMAALLGLSPHNLCRVCLLPVPSPASKKSYEREQRARQQAEDERDHARKAHIPCETVIAELRRKLIRYSEGGIEETYRRSPGGAAV